VQGVDDVLAILLALASKEEELEITLISVTFGNIDVRKYASTTFGNLSCKV
jgi:inosine-uridine nucleoside N-ribohydrolase